MRILGIDPGLRVTGFGIIEKSRSGISYVSSGVIKTEPGSLPARLKNIFEGLSKVISEGDPEYAVVEKVFVNVNPQSTLLLGQARGAAICALSLVSIPVHEYSALQVKKSVVGNGRATKIQVQEMIRRLLLLNEIPKSDSADALACAICHANLMHMKNSTFLNRNFKIKRGRLV